MNYWSGFGAGHDVRARQQNAASKDICINSVIHTSRRPCTLWFGYDTLFPVRVNSQRRDLGELHIYMVLF